MSPSLTALVSLGPGSGAPEGLLTAQRRRHQDLHHEVTEDHGEAKRREVPSKGRHQDEIILQPFSTVRLDAWHA